MLVRANNDGSYSANWTPGNIGGYKVHVTVDGCEMPETFKVEVKDPPQGVIPPLQGGPSKNSNSKDHIPRLRKFIAKPSAGLRIRCHPTLQSEQIGVIPVDGTVAIIEELSNTDGVWVRLSNETLAEMAPYQLEGWCLQYNEHLNKTLMVAVAEPPGSKGDSGKDTNGTSATSTSKSMTPSTSMTFAPEPISRPISREQQRSVKSVTRGPGLYTVVKCGASGHNIRSNPNLTAAPIGFLNLGDEVNIIRVKEDNVTGEIWAQLGHDSIEKHCFNLEGDGWSLAVSNTEVQYLESEAESTQRSMESSVPGLTSNVAPPNPFMNMRPQPAVPSLIMAPEPAPLQTMAQPPLVKPRPVVNPQSLQRKRSEHGGRNSPIDFGIITGASGNSAPSASLQGVDDRPIPAVLPPQQNSSPSTGARARPTPTPRHSLQGSKREGSSSPGAARRTPSPSGNKPSFFSKLFRNEGSTSKSRNASASPPIARKPIHINKDIPPELQGVSVKELVKVIGESRANGNGVTPPGTPNLGRKSHSSRSVSPQALGASRSSSPKSSQPNPVTASKSPLSASPLTSRQDSGSQSDTSALVSSITRDLSQSPCSGSRDDLLVASGPLPDILDTKSQHLMEASAVSMASVASISMASSTQASPAHKVMSSSQPAPHQGQKSLEDSQSMSSSVLHACAHDDHNKMAMKTSQETSSTLTTSTVKKEDRSSASSKLKKSGSTGASSKYDNQAYIGQPGPVKEAMSPSVAESIRSVFAAFVWHEGVVHDTMAVASYLKFQPALTKQGTFTMSPGVQQSPKGNANSNENPHEKARQRHSVEVISTAYLKAKADSLDKSSINANTNQNKPTPTDESIPEEETGLQPTMPPTLKLLVLLWEEIRSYCKHAILQQIMLTSPLNVMNTSARKSTDHHSKRGSGSSSDKSDRKAKKSKRPKTNEKKEDRAIEQVWPAALHSYSQNLVNSSAAAVSPFIPIQVITYLNIFMYIFELTVHFCI